MKKQEALEIAGGHAGSSEKNHLSLRMCGQDWRQRKGVPIIGTEPCIKVYTELSALGPL